MALLFLGTRSMAPLQHSYPSSSPFSSVHLNVHAMGIPQVQNWLITLSSSMASLDVLTLEKPQNVWFFMFFMYYWVNSSNSLTWIVRPYNRMTSHIQNQDSRARENRPRLCPAIEAPPGPRPTVLQWPRDTISARCQDQRMAPAKA